VDSGFGIAKAGYLCLPAPGSVSKLLDDGVGFDRGDVEFGHFAGSFEMYASVYEDRWGVEMCRDSAGDVQLDGRACSDGSSHSSAANNHIGNVDLSVNLGTVADNQGVFGMDSPCEGSVDTNAAFEQ